MLSESTVKSVRSLVRRFWGIPASGVMLQGESCHVEDPTREETHGDVLHPCIRFIEEGFEGHHWWMVYTPYYGGNDMMENPRLCYSDAKEGEIPTRWAFYCQIAGRPVTGYNSDPTLLFHHGSLFVFFRENYTEAANKAGCSRVTRGCRVSQRRVTFFDDTLLTNVPRNIDREVCPTFLADETAGFRAYTMHLRFCSRIMYSLPKRLANLTYSFLDLLSDFCIYSRFRCKGVGIWHSSELDKEFVYDGTVKFKGCSRFYHPWHMDLFQAVTEGGGKALFAVVLTDIKQGDICLARSDDGMHFSFYRKPLVVSPYGMDRLYKPSAVVVDGTFLLFYTYLDKEDGVNKLLVSADNWLDVLQRIS